MNDTGDAADFSGGSPLLTPMHSNLEGNLNKGLQDWDPKHQDTVRLRREEREYELQMVMLKQKLEMEKLEAVRIAEEQKRRHEVEMKLRDLELEKLRMQGREHSTDNSTVIVDKGPNISHFKEGDDINVYLRTFEKIAIAHHWPRNMWALKLVAHLSGKAQAAFSNMSDKDSNDYDLVKAAILQKYELTAEKYRSSFRSVKWDVRCESFTEWGARMENLLEHWLEAAEVDSMETMIDLLLREQIIENSPYELKIWIREREPKSRGEVIKLAEQYIAAHGKPKTDKSMASNGKFRKWQSNSVQQSNKNSQANTCFKCGKPGHITTTCPMNLKPSSNSGSGKGSKVFYCAGESKKNVDKCLYGSCMDIHRCKGLLNGQEVVVLQDTGCTQTLIKSKFVSKRAYLLGQYVCVRLADSSTRQVPMARVHLNCKFYRGKLDVGVLDTLAEDVILGNEVYVSMTKDSQKSTAYVVTRGKSKALKEKNAKVRCNEQLRGVHARPVEQQPESVVDVGDTNDSIDDQGELDKVEDHNDEIQLQVSDNEVFDVFKLRREELIKLQQSDVTLTKVHEVVVPENMIANKVCFFWKDGLLFRQWRPMNSAEAAEVTQLVVPLKCRGESLRIAHDIPLAGHLGIEKTKQRVLQHFYWPGIFSDVAHYCRTCAECQKSAKRYAHEKVPMISMPIVDVPFRKVAIDLVGPLPLRSKKGNKYILVLCDYATRYPEALPIPNMEAETVADCLIEIFSRVGIPNELLSDQGTNFMSKLISDMCVKLHINKLKTSIYHPQCNGLVERFNGTLKCMLRRYTAEHPKVWDTYLPHLLFAYREVPQASTGFAPFELLYGRHVRGPLAVLKEGWTGDIPEEENLAEYVINMRDKIGEMMEVVKQNMVVAQAKQIRWYDVKARDRSFDIGEKVLVLLPSRSQKLQAEWQGPFQVTRKMTAVDYEVNVGSRRKTCRVYHINMLRPWKEREEIACFVDIVEVVKEENDVLDACFVDIVDVVKEENGLLDTVAEKKGKENWKDVKIYENLSEEQRAEVLQLLERYGDVFTDAPGLTGLVEHEVVTCEGFPLRQKPYRLPQAVQSTVREELDKMLKSGVIRPSKSPWASPIVLVGKKDGWYS
ncbi:uncharacterized protein LOC144360596 [Saccoglossus kowalevskii]